MDGTYHCLNIDIETYSDVDIKTAGLYKYAQSPAFEVLLFGYSLNGGPRIVVDLTAGETIHPFVLGLLRDPFCFKLAYNAAFEWYCLSRHLQMSDAETAAWISQWRCTQLHGLYCGYPAGLEAAGKALGLPQDKQKMAAGKALIKYFCVPCTPTKTNGGRTRNLPHHDPDKWALFKEYNAQDVVTEMEIGERLSGFPVPAAVQKQWETDQLINLRGVAVDIELVEGALDLDAAARADYLQEAVEISGLNNPNSVGQLAKWLQEETGEEVENLRKDTVSELLGKDLSSSAARRMLEIRKELGKTSNKKYNALEVAVCADRRVRGLLQFYGANRTGRWAGRIVQPQNLPRTYIDGDLLPLARQLVESRNRNALQMIFGSVPDTLSQLIRTALVAAPGRILVDADFSAIEARVIAWLANEEWVLEVFRTHGKIYEATASQLYGVPIEKIKKGNEEYSLRQYGKAATLALGYQGGSSALITAGHLPKETPEEELLDIRDRWRRSNPAIVRFWYTLDGACSDTCLPWQGRVYIDDVFQTYNGPRTGSFGISRNGRQYMLLSVAIKAGLFHPNCRHTITTWIEGVSTMPKPMDVKEIERINKLEKTQRALERKVRKAKRQAEGLTDPEAQKAAKAKVREAQAELREFVKKNGDVLRRDPWRERNDLAKSAKPVQEDTVPAEPPKTKVDATEKLYKTADSPPVDKPSAEPTSAPAAPEPAAPAEPPKRYHDITGNWYPDAVPNSHPVQDLQSVTVDGVTYQVDGHHVKLKYSKNEKEIAELLEREVGGEIYMVPKVEFPQRVRTPDYLFNGSYYDLKTLKTVPPGKNPIFNPAKKCSGQTRKIIYDVTIPNLDPEVILSQVEKVFTDTETQFVDEIVIIRDRTIEKVYKRA